MLAKCLFVSSLVVGLVATDAPAQTRGRRSSSQSAASRLAANAQMDLIQAQAMGITPLQATTARTTGTGVLGNQSSVGNATTAATLNANATGTTGTGGTTGTAGTGQCAGQAGTSASGLSTGLAGGSQGFGLIGQAQGFGLNGQTSQGFGFNGQTSQGFGNASAQGFTGVPGSGIQGQAIQGFGPQAQAFGRGGRHR